MDNLESAKSFENLIVWKKAHQFVLNSYIYSSNFPKYELFGLTSQYRRAAVSIAANIAEGFKKNSVKDKLRYYNIAQGSLEECKYYLILSKDLNYGENNQLVTDLDEVSKLLGSYIRTINTNFKTPTF